ncbi:hypothetical protein Tco_0010551 [Tanacetum coccineum]
MLEGKLVLVGDDKKLIKPSRLTRVEPLPQEEDARLDLGTIWVKIHDIPIVSFTEDELSAMDTRLADRELNDKMVIVILNLEGEDDVLNTVR